MVSKRRKIVQKNVSIYKGSLRRKNQLNALEVNGNIPLKTDGESVKQFELDSSQDLQIPDEMLSENMISNGKMNNNYIQTNNCRRNSERLKRIISRSNYISVPKKQRNRNSRSNVELNNSSSHEKSCENGETNIIAEKPVKAKRRKKLTEEDIAERLRTISEKLKKIPEDVEEEEEEEDERQEIEHKLMALNEYSGISYLNEYTDFDDRLKDEDEPSPVGSNLKTAKKSNNTADSSETPYKPIIVTQRPDGQLHGCPSCSEVFISELELFRHKREAHKAPKIIMDTEEIKKYYDIPDRSQCPVCKKVLVSKSRTIFIKHLQSHNSVGEFVCSVCKRVFKRKDHMRMHEKRHIV